MLSQPTTLCQACATGIEELSGSSYYNPPGTPWLAEENQVGYSSLWPNRTLHDVKSAALEESCSICKFAVDSLAQNNPHDTPGWPSTNEPLGIRATIFDSSPPKIRLNFSSGWTLAELHFERLEDDVEDLHSEQRRSRLENTLCFIRQALDDCVSSHDKCGRYSGDFLPTRLIDVGKDPSSQPRIVLSSSLDNCNQYFTLTHRWGSEKQFRLLQSNIEELQQQIPLGSLSGVFQDAIKVTQKLGYRYLWIDSLCIIQDCEKDWQMEAELMGSVYGNGACNLAASMASYPKCQNLLGLESWMNGIDTPFKLRLNTKLGPKVYKCSRGPRDNFGLAGAPLNRRGWVLQERLLSPRTIYFGHETVWACRAHHTIASNPKSDQYNVMMSMHPKIWPGCLTLTYDSWIRLVEEFSGCELTNERDRLIAISGLAKHYQQVLKDTYVCGLWQGDIIRELMWRKALYPFSNHGQSYRPKEYRAPSWSWASLEGGRVWYPSRTNTSDPVATIVDIKVESLTKDMTGEISAAAITIIGQVRPIDHDDIPCRAGDDEVVYWDVSDETEVIGVENPRLYILPIIAEIEEDAPFQALTLFQGLVLKLVDEERGVYTRVGVLLSSIHAGEPYGNPYALRRVGWDYQRRTWEVKDGQEGIPLQTITII